MLQHKLDKNKLDSTQHSESDRQRWGKDKHT